MESLISLFVILLVLGIVFWLIATYILPAIPLPPPFKSAILAILALIVIIWLLSSFLGVPSLHSRW